MDKDYLSRELDRKYNRAPPKDNILERVNKRYTILSGMYFTVFRVGEKFKAGTSNVNTSNNGNNTRTIQVEKYTFEDLKKVERHNNRDTELPNVDTTRTHLNKILIGDKDLVDNTTKYLQGVKLRENSVVARELILSASKGFYDRMVPEQQELWVQQNIKFLKNEFGENCIYATLHLDETTPHIHAIIIPRFWNEKRQLYTLNNNRYFNGRNKLAEYQDKYTICMQEKFSCFRRGLRGSKAKHVDLKTYYSLINENLNEYNSKQVVAYAKENYINQKKVQELQEALASKEDIIKAIDKIKENNKKLQNNNEIYKQTIRVLADKYKIPENQVLDIINKLEKPKTKNTENER